MSTISPIHADINFYIQDIFKCKVDMKTALKSSVICLLLVAGACTDLDIQPTDRVTPEVLFKDESAYRAFIARVYAGLAVTGQSGPAGSADISSLDEGFSNYLRQYWQLQELTTDEAVIGWGDAFPLVDTSSSILLSAMDLVAAHQLSTWDATILAAAADARCRLLLSEDLQEGFTWSGVTVVNPFARTPHALLTRLLDR